MFYLLIIKKIFKNIFLNYKFFKRFFDFTLACILIIFFIPIFILIAFFIKASSRGPILFVQKRIGKNKKEFSCYKFRTMHPEAEFMLKEIMRNNPNLKKEFESNQKIINDPRITFLGKYLRFTSLDEIPQILNIIKGEMSFIGPRPITKGEIRRYGKNFEKAFCVLPGMSGLWQVSGRNKLSYKRRIQLDLIYSKNLNLIIDLNIFFRTLGVIFFPFDRGAI